MLNGIIIGIALGLYFGWKLCAWWNKSSIKKATDAAGSVAKKPAQVAKSLMERAKALHDRLLGKHDRKDKE